MTRSPFATEFIEIEMDVDAVSTVSYQKQLGIQTLRKTGSTFRQDS